MRSALGVDLAGDVSGYTGLVEVEAVHGRVRVTAAERFKRERERLFETCTAFPGVVAVDQPFGYSRQLEALISGGPVKPTEASDEIRFRAVDREARKELTAGGLKSGYVLAPTRCDNIWRAMLLLQAAGVDRTEARRGDARIVETHPRVALVALLDGHSRRQAIIEGYKSSKDADGAARGTRRSVIEEWLADGWLTCSDEIRTELSKTDDVFEALVAAFAALAKSLGVARVLGSDPDEGTYVLPPRLSVLVSAVKAECGVASGLEAQ